MRLSFVRTTLNIGEKENAIIAPIRLYSSGTSLDMLGRNQGTNFSMGNEGSPKAARYSLDLISGQNFPSVSRFFLVHPSRCPDSQLHDSNYMRTGGEQGNLFVGMDGYKRVRLLMKSGHSEPDIL